MRFGKGTFTSFNGLLTFNGNWLYDKKHGQGNFIIKKKLPDGKLEEYLKYDGEWESDTKHGHGELAVNGVKYKGNWVHDKRDGHGTQTDQSGTYTGQWKDDKRNGTGIYQSITGMKYVGEWKEDICVGKGVSTGKDENGKVINEHYTDGKVDTDITVCKGMGFTIAADLPDVKVVALM